MVRDIYSCTSADYVQATAFDKGKYGKCMHILLELPKAFFPKFQHEGNHGVDIESYN